MWTSLFAHYFKLFKDGHGRNPFEMLLVAWNAAVFFPPEICKIIIFNLSRPKTVKT